LKLRAGYESRNQSIGDNARFGLYEADTVLIKMYIIRFFNIYYNVELLMIKWSKYWKFSVWFCIYTSANSGLKWETTKEVNVGLDFGFRK
jgi:hypothetical protein